MRTIFLLSAAALLAGCAGGPSRYAMEKDQLERQCHASGGVLVPTGLAPSGRPAAEFACRTSQATRIPQ